MVQTQRGRGDVAGTVTEDDPESHLANPISRGCRASRALLEIVGNCQELEAVPLATTGFSQALEEFTERNYRILMDQR